MKFGYVLALITAAAGTAVFDATAAEPDGAGLFVNHCAACHGRTGEGDGPVASALSGGVPNLRTLATRNAGEFPAEAVAAYIDGRTLRVAHGDRLMPVWGDVFAVTQGGDEEAVAARIELLVQFIRELQYR
jgi:mono/diheme cytochrome c family protein